MRHIKTEGIVIKRRNYNEADRLLTVFTKDLGKITVKAKGVRRITSRRSSHIELLNHSRISLYKAHAMPVLTEIETIEGFDLLKNDLTKVGFAYHICELIDGLCPENQELGGTFDLLCRTLHQLSSCHSSEVALGEPSPESTFVIASKAKQSLLRNQSHSRDHHVASAPRDDNKVDILSIIHGFEVELLTLLGYWNRQELARNLNTHSFIENILERRLRSKKIFSKMNQ